MPKLSLLSAQAQPEMGGLLAAPKQRRLALLDPNAATLKPYEPTFREQTAAFIADHLPSWLAPNRYEAQNLGDKFTTLAEFSPYGLLTAGDDYGRAKEVGNVPEMGAAALAAIPLLGKVGKEARGVKEATEKFPFSSSLSTPPLPAIKDMARASRVEEVPLSQVRRTQSKMDFDKFNSGDHPPPMLKGYEKLPVAVRREDGEYLVFDGHHRTAKAIQEGKSALPMHVIDAKDYAPEFAGRKPQPSSIDDDDLLRELLGDTE